MREIGSDVYLITSFGDHGSQAKGLRVWHWFVIVSPPDADAAFKAAKSGRKRGVDEM
jgi:hypothetical protein